MEFTSTRDINAPIADVFETLSDFEGYEHFAFRRGATVQRIGDITAPKAGLAWDANFTFRGKERNLRIVLKTYEPVTEITLSGESGAISGNTEITLLALSPNSTRMSIKLDLSAKTLSGRLLLQSLKLARGSVERKFKARVGDFAKLTEDRINRTA